MTLRRETILDQDAMRGVATFLGGRLGPPVLPPSQVRFSSRDEQPSTGPPRWNAREAITRNLYPSEGRNGDLRDDGRDSH